MTPAIFDPKQGEAVNARKCYSRQLLRMMRGRRASSSEGKVCSFCASLCGERIL
jgi:hypothetical protein